MKKVPFFFAENQVFREWIRYNFGVFPESGFPGDPIYPEHYRFGPELRPNVGCQELLDIEVSSATFFPIKKPTQR